MTCLPLGTHEKGQKDENAPFSQNVRDEYNCPNRFSIMYYTCYEREEKVRLLDFNDHLLDSHFRTNRARPMLEAFRNGYCVALTT